MADPALGEPIQLELLNQAARRVSPRISIWYKSTSPVGDTSIFRYLRRSRGEAIRGAVDLLGTRRFEWGPGATENEYDGVIYDQFDMVFFEQVEDVNGKPFFEVVEAPGYDEVTELEPNSGV